MSFIQLVGILLSLAHVAYFHGVHGLFAAHLNKRQIRILEKHVVSLLEILLDSDLFLNFAGAPVGHIEFERSSRELRDSIDLEGLLQEV